MTNTAEILVLLCFLGMAAVGVAGSSKTGDATSANWLAGAGLVGVVVWVCWPSSVPEVRTFTNP